MSAEETPAPASQVQEFPYKAAVESTEPMALHINALALAKVEHLGNVRDTWKTLTPLCAELLTLMVLEAKPGPLPLLIVTCSIGWLADETGRSKGHVDRAVHVLELRELVTVLQRGGQRGETRASNVYLLHPNSAPAQRSNSALAQRSNSALARCWGGKHRCASALLGTDSLLSTSVVVVTTTAAEKERAVELLRKEVDEPTAKALVALPEATEGQVTIALKCLDEYRASGHKVKNVGALLRRAITQKWTPGMSPEERRQAARPEHVQEQSAIERQQRAELDAKERAALELVKYCPDAELVKHIATAAAAHNETVAKLYATATPQTIRQPNMFVGLRPEVAKLIKAAAKRAADEGHDARGPDRA